MTINRNLCIVDIETTGLNPFEGHEIIEIGIVKTDRMLNKILEENIKVTPTDLSLASSHALKLTGYTDLAWENSISVCSALEELNAIGADTNLVAHNVTFEWLFLSFYYNMCNLTPTFHYHRYCTMSMFKALNPDAENSSLNTALEYYGLEPETNVHIGVVGAKKCYELLKEMI